MLTPENLLRNNGNGVWQNSINSKNIYNFIETKQEEEKQKDMISYSSFDESAYLFKVLVPADYEIEKKSQKTISIIRTFYTNKMKESLEWLSMNHETAIDSTPYIKLLLENLIIYKHDHLIDPYSSFVSALYDALVFNDSWMQLDKEQFEKILRIIIPLSNNKKLDYDIVDKAINKLEKLGLDTTPF